MCERMNSEAIREYVRNNIGRKRRPTQDDIETISRNIETIQVWYYDGIYQFGHFLTYLVKNDLVRAVCQADSTNLKYIDIYAKFLYNRLPQGYIEKARAL